MHKCPQNHDSTAPDYCSVCGIEITSAPVPAAPPATCAGACPDCSTPRKSARQVFCEVCGYNFNTGNSGIPPAAATTMVKHEAAPAKQTVEPSAKKTMPSGGVATADRWEVEVSVDAALYGKPNPDAPVKQPKQVFPLFDEECLIGRAGTEVRVQVPIRDAGVSRRQALLLRRNGGLLVRDLNSANGTQLNSKELVPGVDTAVHDGDAIAVGAWTRITVRAVADDGEKGRS